MDNLFDSRCLEMLVNFTYTPYRTIFRNLETMNFLLSFSLETASEQLLLPYCRRICAGYRVGRCRQYNITYPKGSQKQNSIGRDVSGDTSIEKFLKVKVFWTCDFLEMRCNGWHTFALSKFM
jgi:hypothetical protein